MPVGEAVRMLTSVPPTSALRRSLGNALRPLTLGVGRKENQRLLTSLCACPQNPIQAHSQSKCIPLEPPKQTMVINTHTAHNTECPAVHAHTGVHTHVWGSKQREAAMGNGSIEGERNSPKCRLWGPERSGAKWKPKGRWPGQVSEGS